MDPTNSDRKHLELLFKFADLLDQAFTRAGGRSVIADNVSLVVMCSLELEGPKRPGDLGLLTRLSSGGGTKLITRPQDAGLVTRRHHALAQDKRAVRLH